MESAKAGRGMRMKERGWKMEREWECGTDLRYVPFMQREREQG